jgi:acyl-CoA synthetase (AMP-forming)/AMP-acid ligase II
LILALSLAITASLGWSDGAGARLFLCTGALAEGGMLAPNRDGWQATIPATKFRAENRAPGLTGRAALAKVRPHKFRGWIVKMRTMRDMWLLNRRRFPRQVAAVYGDRRFTHDQAVERASKLASALHALGVQHQDRVSLLAMNTIEWFDYYIACEMYGFIASTVNFRLAPPEMAWIVKDGAPKVLIFEAQYAEAVASFRDQVSSVEHFICLGGPRPEWARDYDEFLASGDPAGPAIEPEPDDIVRLLYTSGTTGRPKGVARSQRADVFNAMATAVDMQFQPLSSELLMMPMFHLGAQVMASAIHYLSGTVHLHRNFDPAEILRTIERERIEATHLAPVMVQQVLAVPDIEKYDVSSLKRICYSAAPMPVTVLKRGLEIFGPVFVNLYGQTESGHGSVMYARQHKLDGSQRDIDLLSSVGMENQFVQLRVVDDDGKDCPPGVPGEILMKTPAVMSYYWNNSPATIETLRGGWLRTGDMGKFDDERYLYLVDRKKDMIISGGENIYCREVEEAIMAHAAVQDVAVIGVPDEKWGEAVKAIVIRKPGGTVEEAELIEHTTTLIARYKRPKSVAFVDELPRLPSGKVHKPTLREKYRS